MMSPDVMGKLSKLSDALYLVPVLGGKRLYDKATDMYPDGVPDHVKCIVGITETMKLAALGAIGLLLPYSKEPFMKTSIAISNIGRLTLESTLLVPFLVAYGFFSYALYEFSKPRGYSST